MSTTPPHTQKNPKQTATKQKYKCHRGGEGHTPREETQSQPSPRCTSANRHTLGAGRLAGPLLLGGQAARPRLPTYRYTTVIKNETSSVHLNRKALLHNTCQQPRMRPRMLKTRHRTKHCGVPTAVQFHCSTRAAKYATLLAARAPT